MQPLAHATAISPEDGMIGVQIEVRTLFPRRCPGAYSTAAQNPCQASGFATHGPISTSVQDFMKKLLEDKLIEPSLARLLLATSLPAVCRVIAGENASTTVRAYIFHTMSDGGIWKLFNIVEVQNADRVSPTHCRLK